MQRLTLSLLVSAASLLAQQGPEEQLFEKIYAKLAASYAAGGALGAKGDYLLLAHPGIPMAEDSLTDGYGLSLLADQIPLPARYYQPSGATYSATYSTIINQVETTNFEDLAGRDRALEARRIIYDRKRPGRPTDAYADYLKYRAAHQAAADDLALAQTEKQISGRPVPATLESAVKTALATWESKGNKKTIEGAELTLDKFYQADVKALFGSLLGEFNGAETHGTHATGWYPVLTSPALEALPSEAGWRHFALTRSEKSLAKKGALLPLEAKPGGPAPAQALPSSFISSVSLTLEAKRVAFARPWLSEKIFGNRGWRMLKNTSFTVVSTGNPADQQPGVMPVLVTGVLLSRKLVLRGAWQGGKTEGLKSLGPFALKSANGDGALDYRAAKEADGQMALTVDGLQVIGFFCKPIPKSPDPDANAFRTR